MPQPGTNKPTELSGTQINFLRELDLNEEFITLLSTKLTQEKDEKKRQTLQQTLAELIAYFSALKEEPKQSGWPTCVKDVQRIVRYLFLRHLHSIALSHLVDDLDELVDEEDTNSDVNVNAAISQILAENKSTFNDRDWEQSGKTSLCIMSALILALSATVGVMALFRGQSPAIDQLFSGVSAYGKYPAAGITTAANSALAFEEHTRQDRWSALTKVASGPIITTSTTLITQFAVHGALGWTGLNAGAYALTYGVWAAMEGMQWRACDKKLAELKQKHTAAQGNPERQQRLQRRMIYWRAKREHHKINTLSYIVTGTLLTVVAAAALAACAFVPPAAILVVPCVFMGLSGFAFGLNTARKSIVNAIDPLPQYLAQTQFSAELSNAKPPTILTLMSKLSPELLETQVTVKTTSTSSSMFNNPMGFFKRRWGVTLQTYLLRLAKENETGARTLLDTLASPPAVINEAREFVVGDTTITIPATKPQQLIPPAVAKIQ